jgi:hypothetical protein
MQGGELLALAHHFAPHLAGVEYDHAIAGWTTHVTSGTEPMHGSSFGPATLPATNFEFPTFDDLLQIGHAYFSLNRRDINAASHIDGVLR